MSERWRDKKSEPGFVFHPWMETVDELEDIIAAKDAEIARLREALGAARHFIDECAKMQKPHLRLGRGMVLPLIDDALNDNDAQARSE